MKPYPRLYRICPNFKVFYTLEYYQVNGPYYEYKDLQGNILRFKTESQLNIEHKLWHNKEELYQEVERQINNKNRKNLKNLERIKKVWNNV